MVETRAPLDDRTLLNAVAQEKGAEGEENTPAKQFIPYLVIVDGPHQGTRFQLREGENLIGRSATGVVMLEDQSVSRRHAIVNRTREGWLVSDAGSKNGTYVNGQKLKDPVNVGHNDIVQVGIYALRLITRPVKSEEEMAPLSPDIEGKTVMIASSERDADEHAETRTMAQSKEGVGETEEVNLAEGEAGLPAVKEQDTQVDQPINIEEPVATPEVKRNLIIRYGGIALGIIGLAIVGFYAYTTFYPTKPPPAIPAGTGDARSVPLQNIPVAPVVKNIPVILDFASSPLPARITMEGKDYGMTPVKVTLDLTVGKTYSAEAQFRLDELNEVRNLSTNFTINPDSSLVPILFKAPIGIIKVINIPRDTQLYFEGYYADDSKRAHTAKLTSVVFGKPMFFPYGNYNIELRQPKQMGDSGQYIEDIRFKRDVAISEESPMYELNVVDDDLNKFPVEIRSVPDRADVFIDTQLVGQTPYKGDFPLGEHSLTLRKEGYFDYNQQLKMDINTLYKVEIPLKTTVAGQYINTGNGYLTKGLYKEAISSLAEVFKNSPTPREVAQTQYLLGTCYLSLNDMATALGYFEQARQHPDFKYNAMLGMVSVFNAQKDFNKAITYLVEVLLNATDEQTKKDANALFRQVSPLKSVMYVYTDPVGAKVYVNDKEMAQKTPMILLDLGIGNYNLRVEKDGYISQTLSINLSVTEFNPVIIKLKPVPQ